MNLDDVIRSIGEDAGIGVNAPGEKSRILRKLDTTLEEMDALVVWRVAIQDFTKTVAINKNSVAVPETNIFKPIVVNYVDSSGVEHPLTYRELTNFEMNHSNFGTGTTDSPSEYSIGGGYIFIGPGIMAASTTINGKVRRRLTQNDVEQLPAPMVIDGTVRRLAKKGSPEAIAAWNGWNNNKAKIIQDAKKHTAEQRDSNPLDPMIARNIAYINSL